MAFNADIIGERNGRIFVRPGTPHLAVGHSFSEKFAPASQWRVINDGDVGEAHALRYLRALAEPGQIQFRSLAAIFKLRARRLHSRNEGKQNSNDQPAEITHRGSFSVEKFPRITRVLAKGSERRAEMPPLST